MQRTLIPLPPKILTPVQAERFYPQLARKMYAYISHRSQNGLNAVLLPSTTKHMWRLDRERLCTWYLSHTGIGLKDVHCFVRWVAYVSTIDPVGSNI